MVKDLNSTAEGLVEGIGMELHPYPPPDGGQATRAPMQPQSGEWTLRYNYAEPTTLSVFVTVSFGPPFASTADLSADMTASQVSSLRDWLSGIITAMTKSSTT